MQGIVFYVQYASRNLWRSRRWSAFAMLSVAAGVATVVALRSLGLAIGDALTNDLRYSNHGDITLEKGDDGPGNINFNFGEATVGEIFTTAEIARVTNWAEEHGYRTSQYTSVSLQITGVNDREDRGLLNFVSTTLINPMTYPPTHTIKASNPEGSPLSELFQGGLEVVISENLADSKKIKVGDTIRVSGSDEQFIVRGIVPTDTESGLREIFASFFGFIYFDQSVAGVLSIDPRPNRISIAMPVGTPYEVVSRRADELNDLLNSTSPIPDVSIISTPKLLRQNELIADLTSRFIVVMGLGAMLLGGVGIINTMLVMIRRRTNEIATLKTFGLKGRQVANLFMTEAILLGLFGSLAGALVGVFLARIANVYGERFIQHSLRWRLYPEALLFGVVLGFVVTVIFGVIPVMTAVKVRPATILRPNEIVIPRLGVAQSLGAALFVVLSLGLIAGQIIGALPEIIDPPFDIPLPTHMTIGILGVITTLTILAILTWILWGVVWLVGKLPTFGWIELKIALTNLRAHRIRTATTLLAISTGMFALSMISFYGAGVREVISGSLVNLYGGNIMIISPASFASIPILAQNARVRLGEKLDELGDDIIHRTDLRNYDALIAEVDGVSLRDETIEISTEELNAEYRLAHQEGNLGRIQELNEEYSTLFARFVSIWARASDNGDFGRGDLIRGRRLTPEDHGKPVMTLLFEDRFADLGVHIGSEIIIDIQGNEFTFEVVGMFEDEIGPSSGNLGNIQLPGGILDHLRPNIQFNTILVKEDDIHEVILEISEMPGFFPLDVAVIDTVISSFINQFSALPFLVGVLSLGAAAVIMANTVALATLERRRQIGILKAVGLKSRRVLTIMLLENTIVSLLGGFLGIGLSAIGIAIMTQFGLEEMVFVPHDAQPFAVFLVTVAAVIGATTTFVSARPAARERVMNVLRYD